MAVQLTMTASWGADGFGADYGIVTDATLTSEAIHQPLENEEGAVIDTTKYDERTSLSMTIQVKKAAATPAVGATLTYDSKTYYITRVEKVYSNKDYQKLRIDAERHTNWPTTSAS